MSEPNTLIINRFDSKCGACGKGASPLEKSHDTTVGYYIEKPAPPACGEKFTKVRSDYTGMKRRLTAMRPDLEWVGWRD